MIIPLLLAGQNALLMMTSCSSDQKVGKEKQSIFQVRDNITLHNLLVLSRYFLTIKKLGTSPTLFYQNISKQPVTSLKT